MNCREKILSEDYMSILLDYVPEEANQTRSAPAHWKGRLVKYPLLCYKCIITPVSYMASRKL